MIWGEKIRAVLGGAVIGYLIIAVYFLLFDQESFDDRTPYSLFAIGVGMVFGAYSVYQATKR